MRVWTRVSVLSAHAGLIAACGADVSVTATIAEDPAAVFCTVSTDELFPALIPDGIISLQDPPFVSTEHPDAAYVDDGERVIGFLVDGEPLAIPLNVMRFHEVVNLTRPAVSLAVTFCPLTGSSLIFDRSGVGGFELGVSGLLHRNNLVLFDRTERSSLFTQMRAGVPTCGPSARSGASLSVIPSVELRWDAWKHLHPTTMVASRNTGSDGIGNYDVNIHEEYERIDNPFMMFPQEIDPRRPPKERVLGIPLGGDGGLALPFEELRKRERWAVSVLSGATVVFWDDSAEAAIAFSTEVEGQRLTFEATETGFLDAETGSEWRLDGLAVSGPLAGRVLEPVVGSFVSFWFAWASFYPETVVWNGR
jgi:hypothetical protein